MIVTLSMYMIVGCGSNTEQKITGTYVSLDGQTIALNDDKSVQYSDVLNSDTSSGTWEIVNGKVIVHRTTSSGKKRHDISAEIPDGKITSLLFEEVEDSEGSGSFNSAVFTRTDT